MRRGWIAVAVPLGCLVAWLSIRVAYYGDWLPNTFHAKVGSGLSIGHWLESRTSAYLTYTWGFAKDTLGFGALLPFCLVGFGALVLDVRSGARDRACAALLAVVPLIHVLPWMSGGDWMAFWRFHQPGLPATALLAALGAQRLHATVWLRRLAIMALLLTMARDVEVAVRAHCDLRDNERVNPAMHSASHEAIGRALAAMARPGDTVAVNEIGAIGYLTGLRIIDLLGLTDRAVPQFLSANDLAGYANYIVREQEPRFVLINDRQAPGDSAMHPIHAALHEVLVATGYTERARFPLNGFKNLLLFVAPE